MVKNWFQIKRAYNCYNSEIYKIKVLKNLSFGFTFL